MTTFTFRQAVPEDLDALLELEARCFPEEPWSRQMFSEELKNDMALFMVAEDRGESGKDAPRLIGYIIAWAIPPFESQVGSIAVLPEYRRLGLGRQFMEILFEVCRETGIADVYLEVRVSNTAAIKLYESLGFTTDGLRKYYYQNGEDAYTMARHDDGVSDLTVHGETE